MKTEFIFCSFDILHMFSIFCRRLKEQIVDFPCAPPGEIFIWKSGQSEGNSGSINSIGHCVLCTSVEINWSVSCTKFLHPKNIKFPNQSWNPTPLNWSNYTNWSNIVCMKTTDPRKVTNQSKMKSRRFIKRLPIWVISQNPEAFKMIGIRTEIMIAIIQETHNVWRQNLLN